MNNDGFRFNIIQFPIVHSPQNVLYLIPMDAEIQTVQRGEQFVPRIRVLQRLQDRIADEYNIRVFFASLR